MTFKKSLAASQIGPPHVSHIPAMLDPCWYWIYKFRKTRFAMISTLTETLLAKNAPLSNFWKSWGRCPHTPVEYVKHQSGVEENQHHLIRKPPMPYAEYWKTVHYGLTNSKGLNSPSAEEWLCRSSLMFQRCISNLLAPTAFSLFRLSQSPSQQDQQGAKEIGHCCAHVTWENVDLLGGTRTAVFQFQIICRCTADAEIRTSFSKLHLCSVDVFLHQRLIKQIPNV